jgi:hypothetical protein
MGALNEREKKELRQAGFLYREITLFNNAKTPDGKQFQNLNTTSSNWRDMLKSRREWVDRLRSYGWSNDKIIQEILAYYSNKTTKKRTPFDFLQLESSPHAGSKRPSDGEIIRQRKKKETVRKRFGKAYAVKHRTARHLRRPA